MTTTAQEIANLFNNDGSRFEAADGTELEDVIDSESDDYTVQHDEDNGTHRYIFHDGSVLTVEYGSGWDFGFAHALHSRDTFPGVPAPD